MLFSNLFCFTLLLWKSAVCMDTVFYGRVRFLSRAASSNWGLSNWSCMSRSVKGDMLVCMVSTLSWYPVICHVRFVVSDLIIPGFSRNWCHYPYNTPICLNVLSFVFSVQVHPSFCWLCYLSFQNQKIQIFPTLLAEKGTHLGQWQTFQVFHVVKF